MFAERPEGLHECTCLTIVQLVCFQSYRQIVNVMSADPLAISFLVGQVATETTEFLCPFKSTRWSPVSLSQMRIVLSRDPDTTKSVVASSATERT